MITDIAFTAYPAEDVAALRAFYVDRLGVPLGPASEFEGKAAYTEGRVGSGWFALLLSDWMERPKGSGAGVVFEVDDLSQLVLDLRAKGLSVDEPAEFPTCWLTSLIDPERNKVSSHQAKTSTS